MGLRGLALGAALVFAASGCMFFTTKQEGRDLREAIDQLKSQVVEINQREGDLHKATIEAKSQVARLREVLEQATNLVTRNSADLGLQVQKVQTDLASITGKAEETSHSLEALAKQLGEYRAQTDVKLEGLITKTPAAQHPAAPEGKEQLFEEAYRRYQGGQLEESRRLFRTFTTRFSRDDRADNAQYWVAQSYYEERKYAAAIAEYKKVVDGYPHSDVVDAAMYGMGLAFIELKYCTEGEAYLQEILKRFPRSALGAKVKPKLKELRKVKRNKRLCMT